MGAAELVRRPVFTAEECRGWIRSIYAARAAWTPCFEGVQFTLGRAYYTHLEEGRADAYFAAARQSDALVGATLPGMQERVRDLLSELLGAAVKPRSGWCGPGVHVFPAGGWLARNGGDVHFDTEGLHDAELAARVPALSAIIMLQPASQGGGLRVWDSLWSGDESDESIEQASQAPSTIVPYGTGDLVVIDSYRLHQIQPFGGSLDRVSVTAHAIFSEGQWQAWF